MKFEGFPGSAFNIIGEGFGEATKQVPPGTVTLNGSALVTTSWRDTIIKGVLPKDATYGPVVVTVGAKKFTATYAATPVVPVASPASPAKV